MSDVYVKVRGYHRDYHFIGPYREVADLISDMTYGWTVLVQVQYNSTATDAQRDLAAQTAVELGTEIASQVKHGRYLKDLHAFRGKYGYEAAYQELWRELGPAEPRPLSSVDDEIRAFYEDCRKSQIDSGD